MAINRLAAVDENLWEQPDSTSDIQFLVLDPDWQTIQASTDPDDAILYMGGDGYLKKSVNGGQSFSSVLPAIDPPNDFSDSPAPTKTDLIYQEADMFNGNIVVVANWQNNFGEWRSWLLVSDDEAATWTWGLVPNTVPTITLEDINYQLSSDGVSYGAPSIRMNDADADSGFFVTTSNNRDLYLCSYSGTTIPVVIDTFTVGRIVQDIIKLTSLRFAIMTTSTSSIDPTVHLFSIDGGYTTLTQEDQELLHSEIYSLSAGFIPIGSSTRVISWLQDSGQSMYVRQTSFAGDVVTYPNARILWRNIAPNYKNIFIRGADYVVSGSTGVAAYIQIDDLFPFDSLLYATVFDYNAAGNVTFGSDYQIDSASMGGWIQPSPNTHLRIVARLKSTPTFIVTFASLANGTKSWVGLSVSGTVVTSGTPYHGPGDLHWPHPARIDDNLAQVFASRWTGIVHVDDTTLDVTLLQSSVTGAGDTVPTRQSTGLILNSPSLVVQLWNGQLIPVFPERTGLGASFFGVQTTYTWVEAKSLGVSVGKGDGSVAYITYWFKDGSGSILRVANVDVSALFMTAVSLGLASLAEVEAKIYVAYPVNLDGSNASVYVFGRMNDPESLGNPAHIIKSVSSGSSWSLIEGAWSTDVAGAMLSASASLYAVRNTGGVPRFYSGNDASLTQKSLIPFSKDVFPRGMDIEIATNVIAIGSGAIYTRMVLVSPSPYGTWYDLTLNHSKVSDISAVKVIQ